ncbi:hypothetical protein [Nocardioides litoris]|uniref:hypothetical protein n=1 Tax=Nocardioides litoris TaxID=1926648 RepID=UPI00112064D5|nr:hypothetical protein [Nocardioides litoris]
MLRRRLPLIATALVAVLVLAAVAWFVRPLVVRDDRAVDAARRYADLLARGDADAAAEVWAMTVTGEPGALREASRLLPEATEHLEVVSVGDARAADDVAEVPYDLGLVDPTGVEVRYRLGEEEHTGTVVLARPSDLSGTGVGDWVVVAPLVGSVDWGSAGSIDPSTDAYVAGTRIERRPGYLGPSTDEQVQPLYPATYPVQRRLDPWFAGPDAEVTVTAGDPVEPPTTQLAPTAKAQAWLRRSVFDEIRGCASGVDLCPAEDLAEDRGIQPYASQDWWRGLVRAPSVEVGADGITITGGVLRLAGPRGVQDVPFDGTARTVVDNQSWNVYPTDIVLEEARP